MELNPQVVFERMFGDGSTIEQRATRRKRDHSILDSLTGSLSRMRVAVSTSDRARLDDYTENVREIERRLQIAMKASTLAPTDMTVPVGVPQTFDEHIKLQFSLMALAFQADITRVGTLLDHSLVLYGSNMGNSNQHVHFDVPHVLVGTLNGKVKGNRHIAYPTKTVPTGNLLLTVLDKFGISQDSIGDSEGKLAAL